MNTILFNFLEISDQNLEIELYRKLTNVKNDNEGYYFGRLPNNLEAISNNSWSNYSISFEKEDGYELFKYSFQLNPFITNQLLFDYLAKSFQEYYTTFPISITKKYRRIIEINIAEYEQGNQLITLEPYYLKEKKKFGFLIDFRFKMKENLSFDRETQRLSLSLDKFYKSNRDFYKNKYEKVQLVIDGIPEIDISKKKISLSRSLISLVSKQLEKKNYIFNNNNFSNSQFNGVRKFGVYKGLENTNVDFYFIFKENHKILANDLFLSLTGRKNTGTFSGMKSMFGIDINTTNVHKILLDDYSKYEAHKCLKQLDEKIANKTDSIPFVIYIEKNNYDIEQKELYNLFKYSLLKREIAFQVVTNEKLSNQDTLKWSTSSIGLQIFSKLGGIPWIVKPTKDNCLILGIGQAYGDKEESGEFKKQFAYSVCIDSTGLFKKVALLSEDLSNPTDIKSSIVKSLRNLLNSNEFGHYNKCAIHIPFKIKKEIIEAIQDVAEEKSETIEVKVIKVNTKNKFFGYSSHLTRVPYESSYINLSQSEYLVWFEGLNYGKEIVYKRPSSPIHIQFLNYEGGSRDNDMEYLQDILNLSGANWRGFNAKSMPISIYYSQLIADYTLDFGDIEEFDINVFTNNKPWFL